MSGEKKFFDKSDACLAAGRTDSAIELYESSLTGAFEENEYVIKQLMIVAGAEQEFRKMKARFSYFEARYEYGLFLRRAGREEEARTIFGEIIDEAPHLSARERRDSRPWIAQAKSALKEV